MDSSQQNNPFPNNLMKKGKWRQKIKMEKIENENNLQVTFSKRRDGLFKKANELSTLCGAENAIVVFSPSNKAHSYGNPTVETITNTFLHKTTLRRTPNDHRNTVYNDAIMRQRNQEITNLEYLLELEKKRRQEYNTDISQNESPPNLDELTDQELNELNKSMRILRQNYEIKVQNDKLSANLYVSGQNPNAGNVASFPMTTLRGPIIYFPVHPNIQEPNYNMTGLYGYNEAMLTGDARFGLDGSQYPSAFYVGACSYPNVAIQNNPGQSNIGLTFQVPLNTASSNLMPTFNYSNHSELITFDTEINTNVDQVQPQDNHGGIQRYFQGKSQGFPDNYGRDN